MSRYCPSLGVLGRALSSVESQAKGPCSARRTGQPANASTAVLDFLAPSLYRTPASGRRHNASYARTALGPLAIAEASEGRTAPSTSSATSRRVQAGLDRQARSRAGCQDSIDFSTYFDADLPTASSSRIGDPLPQTDSQAEAFADIDASIHAATDAEELASIAKQIFWSDSLRNERGKARNMQVTALSPDAHAGTTLNLNEHFLLSLLESSLALSRQSGRMTLPATNRLVEKYLRQIHASRPSDGLSMACLSRLTSEANSSFSLALLDELLIIVKKRVSHRDLMEGPATEVMGDSAPVPNHGEQAHLWSQMLLNLMQAYSFRGRSRSVRDCFHTLTKHALPINVLHHQYRLISWFREQTSHLISLDGRVNVEQESQDTRNRILETKASMEVAGIDFDDTFLATVISGLSAPLRNPLASLTSVEHKTRILELIRTVFHQFTATKSSKDCSRLPRALSALIAAEIDAIALLSNLHLEGTSRRKTMDRIQALLDQLDAASASCESPIVGTLKGKPFLESQLAGTFLRLRLFAALGNIDQGTTELRRLLSVEPITQPDEASKERDELILKQRSSVITLFSAAMRGRQGSDGQDAGFGVLKAALSPKWFRRVWIGIALPSNPSVGFDPKDYEGDATVLRLWKRWMHAWSADYLAEGHLLDADRDSDITRGQVKYRTFTGSYPWQTLKRGLKQLNLTMDQYETIHSGKPYVAKETASFFDESSDLGSVSNIKPPPPIAQLSSLFTERNVLNNIVFLCLHGGRPPKGETVATHVHRRLSLLVRTLIRVHAPARTWEQFESHMLRHLALIPCEVLPTELVRPTMEIIEQRKKLALLRNKDLVKTLQDSRSEESPPETGTIFVLRQMLNQRALSKAPQSQSAFL